MFINVMYVNLEINKLNVNFSIKRRSFIFSALLKNYTMVLKRGAA
jgi:hypothetical protein